MKKHNLLTSRHFNIATGKEFIKTFAWTMYGGQLWNPDRQKIRKRLKQWKFGSGEKKSKTSWVETESSVRTLQSIKEKMNLMKRVSKKKTKLIGHLIRHNTFTWIIFKRKIFGRGGRTRRRPRTSYYLKKLVDVTWYSKPMIWILWSLVMWWF